MEWQEKVDTYRLPYRKSKFNLPIPKGYITLTEWALRRGVNISTAKNWVRVGKLRYLKKGTRYLIAITEEVDRTRLKARRRTT